MTTKIDLRTPIATSSSEITTPSELFQNQTLRPILKLQNNLCLTLFLHYAKRQKTDFDNFSMEKKKTFIQNSLQKDIGIKNNFIGIIVGMFTEEELEIYISDIKELNRRIITMLIERLQSHIS
jgi:hypothetical protein